MKPLKQILCCVMLLLPMASVSHAVKISTGALPSEDEDNFYKEIMSWEWENGFLYKSVFGTAGNLYIEYEYFQDHVDDGLDFFAKGAVSFLPDLDESDYPEFDGYDDEYGIWFTADETPIDYWIGVNSNIDPDVFFSFQNIYVVGQSMTTPVPLPAASLLFASCLSLLAWRTRAVNK